MKDPCVSAWLYGSTSIASLADKVKLFFYLCLLFAALADHGSLWSDLNISRNGLNVGVL